MHVYMWSYMFICSCTHMSMWKQHVKDTKKGSFDHFNTKRKTQANVGLLLNGVTLVTGDTAGLWNTFLALLFTAKTSCQGPLTQETWGKECWEAFPWVRRTGLESTKANLTSTSPWALRGCTQRCWERVDTMVRPLTIIFGRWWPSQELPQESKCHPFCRMGKEDQGKSWTVSFTSIPGKVTVPHSGGHLCPYGWQEGDHEWSAWIHYS